MFTRRAMLAAAAGVVASRVTDSWAQPAFPTRPLTVVAPFTPGTPADVAARRVAQAMTGTLSQSVVVENRSGAGGTTGSEYVARAERHAEHSCHQSRSLPQSALSPDAQLRTDQPHQRSP